MLFLDCNIKIMVNLWIGNSDPFCSLDLSVFGLAKFGLATEKDICFQLDNCC